jgi:hypothetical protein
MEVAHKLAGVTLGDRMGSEEVREQLKMKRIDEYI